MLFGWLRSSSVWGSGTLAGLGWARDCDGDNEGYGRWARGIGGRLMTAYSEVEVLRTLLFFPDMLCSEPHLYITLSLEAQHAPFFRQSPQTG